MKTVAFITIHVGFNFGSKLQTIATSEVLKKLGYNPVCVNYIPPRVTHKRYWDEAFGNPANLLKRLLFYPVRRITEHNFDGYLSKHCKLSKPFYTEDVFREKCPKSDLYVSGSDQLWNYKHNEGNDKHYFFDGIEALRLHTLLPSVWKVYLRIMHSI